MRDFQESPVEEPSLDDFLPLDDEALFLNEESEKPRKNKRKTKRTRQRELILLGLVIVEILIIGAVYYVLVVYPSTHPTPMVATYFPRSMAPNKEHAALPCPQPSISGQVKNGQGDYVRAWTESQNIDVRAEVDSGGNYQILMSGDKLGYDRQIGRTGVFYVRLYDKNNAPLSGIVNIQLSDCSGGLRFEPYSPPLFPPDAQSRTIWPGPYVMTYSSPTDYSGYPCDFTGFMGDAFDDNGPISGLTLELSAVDNPIDVLRGVTGLAAESGPSGWAAKLTPGQRYRLRVLNPQSGQYVEQVLQVPVGDCQHRLLKISVTQFSP